MIDQNLKLWDQIATSHESTTPLDLEPYLAEIARCARVLEVGSGYGRVLAHLRDLGFANVYGLDGSAVMINRAMCSGHTRVLVGSLAELPFENDSFDCILCIATLSSVPRSGVRQDAICEIARVLRSGGILLFRDFAITLRGPRVWRYVRNFALHLRPFGNFISEEGIEFHHFYHREVRKLIDRAGLSLLGLVPESFTTMHGNPSRGFTVYAAKRC